ncbi:MAG: hypothetical protein K2G03_05465 [Bacilli bacterium]|nr:hypothetical protein [Bacilli bacterium]
MRDSVKDLIMNAIMDGYDRGFNDAINLMLKTIEASKNQLGFYPPIEIIISLLEKILNDNVKKSQNEEVK